jgi:hypothetical protein
VKKQEFRSCRSSGVQNPEGRTDIAQPFCNS